MTKFEKFLKENDAKRQRANAKAVAERRTTDLKDVELGTLKSQLLVEQKKSENILQLISMFLPNLERHRPFEDFLQSIVDILPQDYLEVNEPHINDIIMRHKTLTETNQDLIRVVQKNQDDNERMQKELCLLAKEKNDLILIYNSKMGTQQKHAEALRNESVLKERRIEQRDSTIRERVTNSNQDVSFK